MLDSTSFHDQYPEPNKEAVLQAIEAMKWEIIKSFSLRTEPKSSALEPITRKTEGAYLIAYLLAQNFVDQDVIPRIQGIFPDKFSELIKDEFSTWIPNSLS